MKSVLQNYAELSKCFKGNQRLAVLEPGKNCFEQTLPRNSAIVKAQWFNARASFKSFDTNAASLQKIMNADDKSWTDLAALSPTPEPIFAVQVGKQRLLLQALHLMTKEKKDWFWITAWWSPHPSSDFGADRPAFVKDLGPAWQQYKICAVTSFRDEAEDLETLRERHPSLVAAFEAAQAGNPNLNWCSNPYIEQGTHNQKTNCIGCHQFAGTDGNTESILQDTTVFPEHGTQKQRETFPTDYIWSAGFGSQSLFQIISSNLLWHQNQTDE